MKTKSLLSIILTSGLLLAAAGPAQAQTTYTFTNTATGTYDWTQATNWDANGVPTGSTTAGLVIFPNTTTALPASSASGTANIILNNDPASLTLNTLTLNGLGSTVTHGAYSSIGSATSIWTFDGTSPTITLAGLKGGADLFITVNPNITLNQNLTVTGNGTAGAGGAPDYHFTGFNFAGTISGNSYNITKTGTSGLTLSGNNSSWSGSINLNAGSLWANANNSFGMGTITLGANATIGSSFSGSTITVNNVLNINGYNCSINSGGSAYHLAVAGKVTGTGTIICNTGAGATDDLSGTGNDFTGKLVIGGGDIFNVASLEDGSSIELNNGTFALMTGGVATTFTNRFINLTGTTSGGTINNNSSNPLTINTDLIVSSNGAKTLSLGGSYTGINTFGGAIPDSGSGATAVSIGGSGTWALTNVNSSFTGKVAIGGGTLAVSSIASNGVSCSVGKGNALNAIQVGGNGSTSPTLNYIGAGNTTDRQIMFGYSGNSSGETLKNNGTGALIFTANPFNGDPGGGKGTRPVTLGGIYTGGTNQIQGAIVRGATAPDDVAIIVAGSIWEFSGANTYGGATTVGSGGQLVLDYSTQNNAKLQSTNSLSFGTGNAVAPGGGTITLNSGSYAEAVASCTLNTGAASDVNTSGGSTTTLSLGGITRSAGSTLDVPDHAVVLTGTGTANSILAASSSQAYATVSGTDWAFKNAANTGIMSLPTAGGSYTLTTTTTLGGGNYADVASGVDTTLVANDSGSRTLRFNQSQARTLNLNGCTATLSYGGILVTPNVGANDSTITGGTLTAGATPKELILHQYNPAGNLVINSVIAGANYILTKTGPGTVKLGGNSTYTGATYVDAGTLLVNGTNNSANGTVTVYAGATLGGSGTIGGAVTVNNGGIIEPSLSGSSGSTLTLSKTTAPTFNTGSILKIRAPSSTMDKVSLAAATLNISGMDLVIDVTGLSGNVASTAIVALTGISPVITGPFRSVTVVGGSYSASLDYSSAGQVNLALTATGGGPVSNNLTLVAVPGSTVGYNASVSFTATVQTNGVTATNATGPVVFSYSTYGTNLAVAFWTNNCVAGVASSVPIANQLPRGTNLIIAGYASDGIYLGYTNSLIQTVTNHPPVASAITMGALSGTPATILIIGGKYAPTDADGDPLIVSAVQNPSVQNGTVTTDGTNVTYTALGNFTGADTFTYSVSDNNGGTSTAVITVNVVTNGGGYNLISGPVNNGNGTSTIHFAGIPGYSYALETTPSLTLPITWTPVQTNTAASNGALSFTFSTSAGQGYFRTHYLSN